MKKRLLLLIAVGVCFSPSLYAMGPADCQGVGPCEKSNALDTPGASACAFGAAQAKAREMVQAQIASDLNQPGTASAQSATSSSN